MFAEQIETVRRRWEMKGRNYSDVEQALAAALDVDEDQRGIFRQRLKHLQRLGLPGVEAGKGTRIAYTDEQIAQLLIALLMAEVGIDPVNTVAVIKKRWASPPLPLKKIVREATDAEATAAQDPNPVFFTVRPKLMSKSYPEWIGRFRHYADRRWRRDPRFRQQLGVAIQLERDDSMWLCARNLTVAMTKLRAALEQKSRETLEA
jgi:hypothetical protein